jgi:pimeloyl-ACP methyl ester carboxylesterase
MPLQPEDHFIPSSDGLKLHVRSYGAPSSRLPVVCLPGLARNGQDFEVLAQALAQDPKSPRLVLALDYRGRGQSDYDPKPENYNVPIETGDVTTVLQAMNAEPAIFIGTSRGGLISMVMAHIQPPAVAGVILNDIGPVLEREGLLRIKGYIGKMREPKDLKDGAEILRGHFGGQFPKLAHAQWLTAATRAFKQEGARWVPTYDVALAKNIAAWSPDAPIPDMWAQFEALKEKPVMVIRGMNSDLLSPATVNEMRSRHSGLESIEVPDQGHPPLLIEPEIVARIAEFARRCDQARGPAGH